MTKDEIIRCALDALEAIAWSNNTTWQSQRAKIEVDAIKEALTQPEQEPVAVARVDDLERGGRVRALAMGLSLDAPLYTSPQPAQQSYPDNFIDALMYDVAKRDSEAQQQEPVAWMHPDGRIWTFGRGFDKSTFTIPLYTTPPHRKPWVRLTDEEMRDLEKQFNAERVRTSDEEYLIIYPSDYWAWQRAIEAELREKNT